MDNKIPKQKEGKSLDYGKSVVLASEEEAKTFFEQIKSKLLYINHWNKIAKSPTATFTLTDAWGKEMKRLVQKNDYIRIDIPGPGLPSAEGYDWVQVEDIAETKETDYVNIVLTLRPCPDPTQENTDTAHFFKQLATSSIQVEQKGHNINLRYAGRNQLINTDNMSMLDNLRNFMVGLGAKMGASFPQWKTLIDGLSERRVAD